MQNSTVAPLGKDIESKQRLNDLLRLNPMGAVPNPDIRVGNTPSGSSGRRLK